MILETIISTIDFNGNVNFAPFGIKKTKNFIFISPYIPSKTLNNLNSTKCAVVNYTNDAFFFVNSIIGEKNFKKKKCKKIKGFFLDNCLAYDEVIVEEIKNDRVRPTFKCKVVASVAYKRFEGLNRAQFSLIEACILASRINMLDEKKLISDLSFLSEPLEKTGGQTEKKLWKKIERFISDGIKKKKKT